MNKYDALFRLFLDVLNNACKRLVENAGIEPTTAAVAAMRRILLQEVETRGCTEKTGQRRHVGRTY